MEPAARKPKVLFIMPRLPVYKGSGEGSARYGEFKYIHPPIGILTLAGVISPEYQVEVRDENTGHWAEYDTDADIVAITGLILDDGHIQRMVSLSRYFKSRGKLICMGGPVSTLLSDQMRQYCDVLFEGEGELTWPEFLKDYQKGSHKDYYQQIEPYDMRLAPVPRIDLINAADYRVGSIQTCRGCPFTCEFCDIIVMFGRKVRTKPIETVLKEVQLWADAGTDIIFFADDNFTGNRPYVKELLRALIKFNEKRKNPVAFYTEASIDMAKDKELLELLRDANLFWVFIGIESPRKESLIETKKVQNAHTFDLVEAVHEIQRHGIFVGGGMIIGFDHDDVTIFDEQYEFLQKSGVVFPMINCLHAIPKTPLYERMQKAGRLTNTQVLTNIKPVAMSYEVMEENFRELVKKVNSFDATLERHRVNIKNMRGSKLPLQRRRPTLRKLRAMLKTIGFYLLTRDKERQRFFFQMMYETLRIEPRAWAYTINLLCMYIHQIDFVLKATRKAPRVLEPGVSKLVEWRTTIGHLVELAEKRG